MNNPLVSVIIPTYNRAHLIGETLDSILAQTYQNWECIIVDDGSADNTDEVVNSYVNKDTRFQYHHRPETHKPGGNGARNYGFELSKGEFINWFDSDDLMFPNFLKCKIELTIPAVDIVITSGYNVDSDLSNKRMIELYQPESLFKDYVLWKLKIFTPSVLIRKCTLEGSAFLFSEKITRGQETEFFSRIFFEVKKHQFVISNVPTFLYRQHEETKSFHNEKYVKSFKESQTFIALQNLKRGLELNDCELINYYSKALFDFFFSGLDNNHSENSQLILKQFAPLLRKKFFFLSIKFEIAGRFFCILNKNSYKVEKYFKSQFSR